MKLTKVLAVIMMALMFFIVSCGEDEETETKENATICTDGGNECANNDDGKTSCIELKCAAPAAVEVVDCTTTGNECANNTNGMTVCVSDKCAVPATFGEACSKEDHSECVEAEVCIPAIAANYGMANAETCSTINCTVVLDNEQPTQSDCATGYFCVSLEGEYSSFSPALKDAKSICVTMATTK